MTKQTHKVPESEEPETPAPPPPEPTPEPAPPLPGRSALDDPNHPLHHLRDA
jgi:hypothetical protein